MPGDNNTIIAFPGVFGRRTRREPTAGELERVKALTAAVDYIDTSFQSATKEYRLDMEVLRTNYAVTCETKLMFNTNFGHAEAEWLGRDDQMWADAVGQRTQHPLQEEEPVGEMIIRAFVDVVSCELAEMKGIQLGGIDVCKKLEEKMSMWMSVFRGKYWIDEGGEDEGDEDDGCEDDEDVDEGCEDDERGE